MWAEVYIEFRSKHSALAAMADVLLVVVVTIQAKLS
jgi:hypothetical protein